ncbi:MAG: hypothetical protein KA792_04900 [Bacteroidales bacterium]|nr:hypothetical protein [Bacteroidales bacterium]
MKDLLKLFLSGSKKDRSYYYYRYKESALSLKLNPNFRKIIISKLPLDIIIPAIDKDIETLPYVIDAAKKNIKHPIDKIFIVAPETIKLKELSCKLNCIFINEKSVLGYNKSIINYNFNGSDRSGWLFQQLLKLYSDNISNKSHFLILDADTIFIHNKKFEHNNKIILDFSDEFHNPYYATFEKLTGLHHKFPISFVSHYMLFEAKKLKELRLLIEKHNNCSWDKAIIATADNNQLSCFSEYETYANFVLQKYKREFMISYWFNKNLPVNELINISHLINLYSEKFLSLSFHSYNS